MSTSLTTRRTVAIGAAAFVLATLLFAQPSLAGEDDKARAFALFEQSEEHYKAGELEKAQALLLEAYSLDPNPVLQYNLGRVYEAMGKLQEAATAFRAFLDGMPEASDRGAIERRIEAIEQQIRERESLRKSRERERTGGRYPPKPAPKQEPAPVAPSLAPWIVTGVGAVILVGGAVAGALSNGAHDDAVNSPSFLDAQDSQERAENLATVANVAFIGGGATVAVGLGWLLLRPSDSQSVSSSTPTWHAGPTSIMFRGRF